MVSFSGLHDMNDSYSLHYGYIGLVVDYPPHNLIASALPQDEEVSTAKDLYYVIVSTTGK